MESVLQAETDELFQRVQIRIQFQDKVLAGIPASGKALDYYIATKTMSEAEKTQFTARIESGELTDDEREALKNTSVCKFERCPEGNVCLWHNNVKAMLREMFSTFGFNSVKPIREKGRECAGGKQTFQHAVGIFPLYIPFERAGKPLREADGSMDIVKHIEDASGRRSAIGRHEYMHRAEMSMILSWPAAGSLTEEIMKKAMAAAQLDGLGACRSAGRGTFTVTEWKKL